MIAMSREPRHAIRSPRPPRGVVKALFKKRGVAVKALVAVVRIEEKPKDLGRGQNPASNAPHRVRQRSQ